jgi:hypothetical protein
MRAGGADGPQVGRDRAHEGAVGFVHNRVSYASTIIADKDEVPADFLWIGATMYVRDAGQAWARMPVTP